MRTLVVITGLLLAFAAFGAADSNTTGTADTVLDADPGLIGPDSMLYGVKTFFDSVAVTMGLKDGGMVAQQRAAETGAAQAQDDPEAVARAADAFTATVERTGSAEADGIRQATTHLAEQLEDTPDTARSDIDTAVEQAQDAHDLDIDVIPDHGDPSTGNDTGMNGTDEIPVNTSANETGDPETPQDSLGDTSQAEDEGSEDSDGDDGPDGTVTDSTRIAQAESNWFDGLQYIDDGRDYLHEAQFNESLRSYATAEQEFKTGITHLEEADTAEDLDLYSDLQYGKAAAEHLVKTVESHMQGDDAEADEHAAQAEEELNRTSLH